METGSHGRRPLPVSRRQALRIGVRLPVDGGFSELGHSEVSEHLVGVPEALALEPGFEHPILEEDQICGENELPGDLPIQERKMTQWAGEAARLPFHRDGGVDWRTASRSSFLVQTKMGPSKSAGTGWPRPTRKSRPSPRSCSALPTLPPPTITAGMTAVLVAMPSDALAGVQHRTRIDPATDGEGRPRAAAKAAILGSGAGKWVAPFFSVGGASPEPLVPPGGLIIFQRIPSAHPMETQI